MSEASKREQRNVSQSFEVCGNHRAIVDAQGSCLCAARNFTNNFCATETESGGDDGEACELERPCGSEEE